MTAPSVSSAKRRVLERLKRAGPRTAVELAADLDLTDVAIRQHLSPLEDRGLVTSSVRRGGGRGRPAVEWALTDLADGLFPDRHADVTVELIGAIRTALGDGALDRILDVRAETQTDAYRALLGEGPLGERVRRLAEQRSSEGYMAEVRDDADGSFLLVEHHCPICEAATECQGFCRSELEVFRSVLGGDVHVEREQHLLDGGDRCTYRIRRR